MESPRSRIFAFLLRWGPVIFWLGLIFSFSANSDPYRVLPSGWVGACQSIRLGSLCQDEMLGRVSHISEYTILGLLIFRGVLWRRRLAAAGLLTGFVLAYACAFFDEVHQLFVPGRTYQTFDLGLDGLGILLALAITLLIGLARRPAAAIR